MARFSEDPVQTVVAALFGVVVVAAAVWVLGPERLPRLRPRDGASPVPAGSATGGTQRDAERDLDPGRLVEVASAELLLRGGAGGAVELPHGQGSLRIPAGALERDAAVRAVLLRDPGTGDPVIDLQPDGLQLAEPAQVELAVPLGYAPGEVEIVVHEGRRGWVPEAVQAPGSTADSLVAHIAHFSLRRVRIRPGMKFAANANEVRGAFFLESDPANTFESLVDGRWKAVNRQGPAYRDLMKAGRLARHDLIASGRLRAVAGGGATPERMTDDLRAVILPAGAPGTQTGWVRVSRTDRDLATVARVLRTGDRAVEGRPQVVRLSRAAMEALGYAWGTDFGVAEDGERGFVRAGFVPLRIEPVDPDR